MPRRHARTSLLWAPIAIILVPPPCARAAHRLDMADMDMLRLNSDDAPADSAAPAAAPLPASLPAPTPAPLQADTAAAPARIPSGLTDLEVPLLLNGKLIGEIDVKVDTDGKGDVDTARFVALIGPRLDPVLMQQLLPRLGAGPRTAMDRLAGQDFAALYDPATLELQVTVPTARLASQTISVRGMEAPDISRFDPQAPIAGGVAIGLDQLFVNKGNGKGRAPLRVTTDGFLTVGAFPGITLRGGGTFVERDGGSFTFERAKTQLLYDDFSSAIHMIAGELTPQVAGFQGSASMLGVSVGRDYSGIRPFENIRPAGRGGVTLDRPSTVIVETNGVETRRLRLDPGTYQLTDLSSEFGANQVRLIVQDELGRREVASGAFFAATAMLAGGLTDFGFAIGKRESRLRYYGGPLTLTGYVRHGIADRFTLGAGAQYADRDWQIDGEVTGGTPIGLFRLQYAQSQVAGAGGHALSLDYLHTITTPDTTWTFTLLSTLTSRRFASPFDRLGRVNDEHWRIDGRVDWRRGNSGIALVGSFARTRLSSPRQGVDVNGYTSRGRFVFSATLGMEKEPERRWGPRAMLGISIRMGERDTVAARVDSRRTFGSVEYSRTPRDEVGDLSGRVQIARDNGEAGLSADMRYFGNRLLATVEQNVVYADASGTDRNETRVRVGTFIGFAGKQIAMGRPSLGSFAIYARDKSLRGSTVTVRDDGDYVVGKQDWLGNPLVPFNRRFSPVVQTFDVDPLPAGYDLGEGRLTAFPGAASGYLVPVGSAASRVALGYLIAADGPIANLSGQVEKMGDADFPRRPFFTNDNGRFAVDRLSPGRYRMLIGETVVAEFTVPEKLEGMVDVGKISAKAP